MKIKVNYYVKGINNVGTPLNYVLKADVDTGNINSINYNTYIAIGHFSNDSKELKTIYNELIRKIDTKKLYTNRFVNLLEKDLGCIHVKIDGKLDA